MSEATPKRKAKKKTSNLVFKHEREIRHDVFKTDIKKFKENTSFTKDDPAIVEREHTHIYHTVNSQCRPLQYTNAVGGHFHKVTVSEDEDGNLVATCSEPLKYHFRRMPRGGFKKSIGPVSWYDGNTDRTIVDDHVHVLNYMHSEMLNVDSSRKIRNIQTQSDVDGFKDMDQ